VHPLEAHELAADRHRHPADGEAALPEPLADPASDGLRVGAVDRGGQVGLDGPPDGQAVAPAGREDRPEAVTPHVDRDRMS
jgi:hypothetical protein